MISPFDSLYTGRQAFASLTYVACSSSSCSTEQCAIPQPSRASSPAHWREMIRDPSFGNPLIAGLTNDDDSLHAVVVTAITYRRGWDGAPAYESVVIRDPWPFNTSFQELAWEEFVGRATFLIRSHISFPQGVRATTR